MADSLRHAHGERDIDQAITALKKGAYLLKYGRRGRPKFCPFRLSPDESSLIWYYGKQEKKIELRNVTRILPGQRTAIFQRYPRPEKDYQSFSLLYDDRSLDLICKDKDEAEVWFAGLKALISRGSYRKIKYEAKIDGVLLDSPNTHTLSISAQSFDLAGLPRSDSIGQSRLGKAFADIVSYTSTNKNYSRPDITPLSLNSASALVEEDVVGRGSTSEALRVSVSSFVSSSSHNSLHEDLDLLGDCFIWGQGTANGMLGGGELRMNYSSGPKVDSYFPKALESSTILNVRSIAGRSRHALLVTKQREVYSWGEESRGRLGHGVAVDVSHPKVIHTLTGKNIEIVECGEFHSCAITHSGDLYTWGDGTISCGLLGHGSKVSHWIPRKVGGPLEGLQISYVSCGPWHTALITSGGQLFSFGDGTFGALGHGDHYGVETPREVEGLKGFRSLRVACGAWHTAAVVEEANDVFEDGPIDGISSGKLFTWGDGDKGRLGHGDNKSRLVPECVASLDDIEFTKVACGCDLTVALTYSGHVYAMGSNAHGQLGSPSTGSMTPICIEGPLAESFVIEIACGSHHVAVLTSKSDVYTWGKGSNGQLGHGDYDDRRIPTLVDSLKDKQVKSITCGSNFTAIICLHKSVSGDENSACSGCQTVFGFRRKKHNCYNCGLVFCHTCSSKRSLKASLAPSMSRPYRVCDDCFSKLQMVVDSVSSSQIPKARNGSVIISRDSPEESSSLPRPRLSSSDSFKQEGRIPKAILNDISGSPHGDGNGLRGSFPSHSSPIVPFGNFRAISIPAISVLRTISPLSRKRSPTESAMTMFSLSGNSLDPISDLTTQTSGMSQDEIKWLKARVEVLLNKSNNLEAELEKKSIQLKEAKTLVEREAEEKTAAMEVIKSLTEQLEEMANRVSVKKTTKSYSRPFSKSGNYPDNLSIGYIADNKEKFDDSNHLLGKHIAEGDADLTGEQKLNDLDRIGEHISNDKSDLDTKQKLNRLKHKSSKYINIDYSDLNDDQNWNGIKHMPGKHLADDYSNIDGEQKWSSIKHKPEKHTINDNSVLNDVKNISGLKHKFEKHIADDYLDLSPTQKRNERKQKHRKHKVDAHSDIKHKSGKHIADDYSDLDAEQKWEGLKRDPGMHTIDDNSDFNENTRSGLKLKPEKHIVDDFSDLVTQQTWNGLTHKIGKHTNDENSNLRRKHIGDDNLDIDVEQMSIGLKGKPDNHRVDENSDLKVEHKRIRIKHKSGKHVADDNLDRNADQQLNGDRQKPDKHIEGDYSELNAEEKLNARRHKLGKHIANYNPDASVEKKRVGLKNKSRKHIANDDLDLNAKEKRKGVKHKPSKHIVDDYTDSYVDNLDIDVEQKGNGLKAKLGKHIVDGNFDLKVEQKRTRIKHKSGKHIADDNLDLNVDQQWNGDRHKSRKHIPNDDLDLNAEEWGKGVTHTPSKHIADDYSDSYAEQKRNGLKHKPDKHVADDFSKLNATTNWNGLEHNLGKHVVDNSLNLNVERKLKRDYKIEEQSMVSREATSENTPSDSSCIREKGETLKQERMIHDEPGIYITLCELPSGGNKLKRVRFSRKRFSEQQADNWWKDNISKIKKRHDIRIL